MTRRLGLLHTVPALAGSFDAAIAERTDGVTDPVSTEHIVDASLLQTAIEQGVTPEVRERVARHVRTLAEDGAEAILVTCSSIGEATDEAAQGMGIPVLRVDRPMPREAVRLASAATATATSTATTGADHTSERSGARAGRRPGRIAVLATLEATLGPTGRLIAAEAAEVAGAGGADGTASPARAIEVTSEVVADAAAAHAAGDQERHDDLIRAAVERAAAASDVIVLAQASMANAVPGDLVTVPVLTSPASALEALLSA